MSPPKKNQGPFTSLTWSYAKKKRKKTHYNSNCSYWEVFSAFL